MSSSAHDQGISLRQAAVTSGVGLLVMAATSPFAEFHVYPTLVVASAEETCRNILAHQGLFVAGIVAFLINFVSDVVVAWSLYVLLKPVNAALSLLTAWFRLIYTAVALVALLNLVTVLRLLNTPD